MLKKHIEWYSRNACSKHRCSICYRYSKTKHVCAGKTLILSTLLTHSKHMRKILMRRVRDTPMLPWIGTIDPPYVTQHVSILLTPMLSMLPIHTPKKRIYTMRFLSPWLIHAQRVHCVMPRNACAKHRYSICYQYTNIHIYILIPCDFWVHGAYTRSVFTRCWSSEHC